MRRSLLLAATSLAAVCLLHSPVQAQAQTQVQAGKQTVVFGDSGAEQGNLYALPGMARASSPYYAKNGFSRESNGPVWVEYLAPGTKPYLEAGLQDRAVNYAFSGATSGVDNIATPVETGLKRQIDTYAARLAVGAPKPARQDLFIIEAGVNDFIRDLGQRDLRDTSREVVANIGAAVSRLDALGARRILVEEVPNFARAPAFNDIVPAADRPKFDAILNDLGAAHRAAQIAALRKLRASLNGDTNVVVVPVNKLFEHVLNNAAALGFKSVNKPCYDESTGVLCSTNVDKQNEYLFFDGLHLSTKAQAIQADYYAALLNQLDGGANLVAAGVARNGLLVARDIAASAQSARHGRWLTPDSALVGWRPIAELAYNQGKTDASARTLAMQTERRSLSVGAEYRDGAGWSGRALLVRHENKTDQAQGHQTTDSWAVAISGERSLGAARLGATVATIRSRVRGERRLPVALMKVSYRPDLDGQLVDFEAGYVLKSGALTVVPTAFARYAKTRWKGFTETGGAGLEMTYRDYSFESLQGGASLSLAYALADDVRPSLRLTYEHRLGGGRGNLVGGLVDNSADPITAPIVTDEKSAFVIEPALSIGGDSGLSAELTGRYRPEGRDKAVSLRLSYRF